MNLSTHAQLRLAAEAMRAVRSPAFANFTVLDNTVQLDLGSAPGAVTVYWRPHLDDADGARMEAALSINLTWGNDQVKASHRLPSGESIHWRAWFEQHESRHAARRFASLTVAAALGLARTAG